MKEEEPENYLTKPYGLLDGKPLCGELAEKQSTVYMLTSALSYLLIGLNYVLRMVCIKMVDWIAFPTETERLTNTTLVTFFV